ncbi:NusA-like transcription termination signal-binding factor [Pyrobaculum aerophilum]|uniref:Probable transcription termination protein NusA n=2 Tax=Pyrobaculum aerophilum TaxID=13773 RepID=Q8ZYQ5_PYRAE|nr:NusA-like transcription termination signal-binding factor [Pyrobaculum aerophilum]AAL62938.1 transcription termination factor NusA, putative [Pyrobaculum aerophilum str. IM2]MCX8137469.1 NusA-like transcription termination signal-binding factor [Pyrobaculum aerophilum]RFA94243.1 transcription elongation factor NusA [Pyrobaculum aerophilum]RFA94681.1 transcription elongation factor NusA [Pyrobaculum aerophilum]HII46074.1 NusA-like transcription termination signal-binding factor [Pyrobaculum 
MPDIRLTEEEIRYATLFESITGVTPIDVVIDPEYSRIIYVVQKNQAAIAVGKGGSNVKMLRQIVGKDVEVVEAGDTPEELIKNSLYPAKVIMVKVTKAPSGAKVAITTVAPEDKGVAIGKNGRNIARAKLLAKRYYDIEKIILA